MRLSPDAQRPQAGSASPAASRGAARSARCCAAAGTASHHYSAVPRRRRRRARGEARERALRIQRHARAGGRRLRRGEGPRVHRAQPILPPKRAPFDTLDEARFYASSARWWAGGGRGRSAHARGRGGRRPLLPVDGGESAISVEAQVLAKILKEAQAARDLLVHVPRPHPPAPPGRWCQLGYLKGGADDVSPCSPTSSSTGTVVKTMPPPWPRLASADDDKCFDSESVKTRSFGWRRRAFGRFRRRMRSSTDTSGRRLARRQAEEKASAALPATAFP